MSADINETLGFAVNAGILVGTLGILSDVVNNNSDKKKKKKKGKMSSNNLNDFDPIGDFKF